MTTDRPATSRFALQFAVLIVGGIWGLAVLSLSLTGALAQDDPQPADNAAPEDTDPAPADAPAATQRLAYLNIERVIRAYPKWWVRFDALKTQNENNQKELQEEERALRALQHEIERGQNVSEEKFQEFARRRNLFELNKRKYETEIERDMRELSEEVYNDLYEVLETVADGKYDSVLGINEREIRTGTQSEFFQKITVRAVVIHDDTYDVTDELIVRMTKKAINDGVVADWAAVDQGRASHELGAFDATLTAANNRRAEQGLEPLTKD